MGTRIDNDPLAEVDSPSSPGAPLRLSQPKSRYRQLEPCGSTVAPMPDRRSHFTVSRAFQPNV